MNNLLNDIFKQIQNIQILEPVSDPEQVLKYFLYISKHRDKNQEKNKDKILENSDRLFDPATDTEEKRILIVQIAGIDDLQARKILEKYAQNPDDELKDWIKIALQENTALLQSSFLGEPQILISSGLGGKDNKLKYFVIFRSRENKPFEQWQKKLLEKEIKFHLEKHNAEIEQLDFGEYFVRLVAFIPLQVNLQTLFDGIIDAVNEIGNFMDNAVFVRNDKILDNEETENFLQNLDKIEEKEAAAEDKPAEEIRLNWDEIRYLFDIDDKDESNNPDDDNPPDNPNEDK